MQLVSDHPKYESFLAVLFVLFILSNYDEIERWKKMIRILTIIIDAARATPREYFAPIMVLCIVIRREVRLLTRFMRNKPRSHSRD